MICFCELFEPRSIACREGNYCTLMYSASDCLHALCLCVRGLYGAYTCYGRTIVTTMFDRSHNSFSVSVHRVPLVSYTRQLLGALALCCYRQDDAIEPSIADALAQGLDSCANGFGYSKLTLYSWRRCCVFATLVAASSGFSERHENMTRLTVVLSFAPSQCALVRAFMVLYGCYNYYDLVRQFSRFVFASETAYDTCRALYCIIRVVGFTSFPCVMTWETAALRRGIQQASRTCWNRIQSIGALGTAWVAQRLKSCSSSPMALPKSI